jgi:hypothetical protein
MVTGAVFCFGRQEGRQVWFFDARSKLIQQPQTTAKWYG